MEKNYFKTTGVRYLGDVDIMPLIKILPELITEWDKTSEVNSNKTRALFQVNHINFRWSKKKNDPVTYFDLPLWEKYKYLLLPAMIKAVEPIGYKSGYFPRVMFANMNPGTLIPEHIDGDDRGWTPHKIHIPLLTNPDVIFFVHGQEYCFERGKAYEVDNSGKHGVKNNGTTARVHFIFEYLDAAINDVPQPDFEL